MQTKAESTHCLSRRALLFKPKILLIDEPDIHLHPSVQEKLASSLLQIAREKGIKRRAIKQCWKDYERKSLEPSTKRFVASVCEKIEHDFTQQYGVEP